MTDKAFERERRRIQRVVDGWLGVLGLLWWQSVACAYHRTQADMADAVGRPDDTLRTTVAEAVVNWEYKRATIHWNCSVSSSVGGKELDYFVCHELAHLLVSEMREYANGVEAGAKHEERTCTSLAQAFILVRASAKGRAEGKRGKG